MREGKINWDKPPKRPRNDAKIKNLAREHQAVLWELRNPTDEATPAYTQEQCAVWLLEEHNLEVSTETVSKWEDYYAMNLRYEASREHADQAMEEFRRANPEAALREVEQVGQLIFTTESVKSGGVKNFIGLRNIRLKEDVLKQKEKEIKQKDRLLSQKDTLIDQQERRLVILEETERRKVEAEDAIKRIHGDHKLSHEEQRAAIIDKMDEFFGLKKPAKKVS